MHCVVEGGLQEVPGGRAEPGAHVQRRVQVQVLCVRAGGQGGGGQGGADGPERVGHLQRALVSPRGIQDLRHGARSVLSNNYERFSHNLSCPYTVDAQNLTLDQKQFFLANRVFWYSLLSGFLIEVN